MFCHIIQNRHNTFLVTLFQGYVLLGICIKVYNQNMHIICHYNSPNVLSILLHSLGQTHLRCLKSSLTTTKSSKLSFQGNNNRIYMEKIGQHLSVFSYNPLDVVVNYHITKVVYLFSLKLVHSGSENLSANPTKKFFKRHSSGTLYISTQGPYPWQGVGGVT